MVQYSNFYKKMKDFEVFLGEHAFRRILMLTLVGILSFGIEASFIFVLQGFFKSTGLVGADLLFLPSWYPDNPIYSLIFLLLFGLSRSGISVLKERYSTNAQFAYSYKQRKNLFVIGLKYPYLIPFKEIFSLFSEVVAHSALSIFNCAGLLSTILTSVFFVGLGFRLAPLEMLVGLIFLGGVYFPIKKITLKIEPLSAEISTEWESVNNFLLRGLRNNLFVNIYNQVDQEINNGLSSLNKYNIHYQNYSHMASFASTIPAFLGIGIVCILSFISIHYTHTESMKLVSFFYIFIRLSQSASEASGAVSKVRMNLPKLRKLYKIHNTLVQLERQEERKVPFSSSDELVLEGKNLTFHYKENSDLFSNINFKISVGQKLLIKGESGSGKSSLLSLIFGLNEPTNGSITLNGLDTAKYDFQKILSYVGPEPFLIQGTLRENLTYGLSSKINVSEIDIWEALRIVALEQLVMQLPHRLDELVGDIPSFSTGQKQRLSLARGIIRSPQLIVLDEATANLDTDTEKKIIHNLNEIFSKSIVVIVSHKNTFDSLATYVINL